MIKKLVWMGGLLGSIGANALSAVDIVDVYGLDKKASAKIIKKYGKDVAKVELSLQNAFSKGPIDEISTEALSLRRKELALIEKIKKENGFKYVNFDTIIYPSNDTVYTTIEIIDKHHPERLRFVSPKPILKKRDHPSDLIDAMMKYNYIGSDLMIHHQISAVNVPCPVFHCTSGFEHPQLKPYLKLFNEGAVKQKSLIIQTLKHDKDPERRAAAAFLTAHFKDPHEILSLLSERVNDPDDGVRNNVMRTTAETIARSHLTEINVMPFIDALDSPHTTDRNKALFVLEAAADGKKSNQMIREKGSEKLLTILELKQPNNHNTAYVILKKISGKKYAATDIAAWKKWVASIKQ